MNQSRHGIQLPATYNLLTLGLSWTVLVWDNFDTFLHYSLLNQLQVADMSFERLIRFESEEDGGATYFADIGLNGDRLPPLGTKLDAFKSVVDLINKTGGRAATVKRVCGLSHCAPRGDSEAARCLSPPDPRRTGLNVGGKSKHLTTMSGSCWRRFPTMGSRYTAWGSTTAAMPRKPV